MLYELKVRAKNILRSADKLWIGFSALIMLKSMLFLSMLHTTNSSGISIKDMYFSAPPILSHIMMIAALMSFAFLLSGKKRIAYYICIDFFITALLIGDIWYYRTNGSFLSLRFFISPELFNPMHRNIAAVSVVDLLFLADLPAIILVYFKKRMSIRYKASFRTFAAVLLVSVLHISNAHYLIDKIDITKGVMMMFKNSWAPFQTMSNLSPIGYHSYDIFRELTENKTAALSEEDNKEIEKWFSDKQEKLPDNEYRGMLKGKNLIAIQVESLENFVIGSKIYGQEITPNLNRLLANSFYFSNVYEQNNVGTSSDADLLVNASLYPVRKGATFFRYPGAEYNSLPKLLKELGYSTASTHPEIGGNWNWAEAHRAGLGFESIYDVNSYKKDELIRGYLSDGTLFRQFEEKFKTTKQPFYAYSVTMTSHGPFDLEDKYKYLKLPKEFDETILGAYFQSIRYVDEQIEAMIRKLKQDGLFEKSVIMIYGDHTGVHKFYNDRLKGINLEGDWWKKDDKKIPFIIYSSGIKGRNIETIGGHIDIMPTIAYMLGVPEVKFSSSAAGRILVKTNKNFTVLNNGEVIGYPANEKEKQHMIKGIHISDKIIQGNYFKSK
jgi:phosphoglycerol transferase MdoB-like AlkP superfamily enzyme